MFKSLDSIASVVGIFMYLTISEFKQVPRSRKGLDYNTAHCPCFTFVKSHPLCWEKRLEEVRPVHGVDLMGSIS